MSPHIRLPGIALALAAAANAPAQRPIVLADYYRIEQAGAPAMSPDGRWVAFVRTYIIEAENRRQSEIWLAPSDGSAEARRLTHPSFSSSAPRWSPDGSLLAFTSNRRATGERGSESNIWFLRMDQPGGEAFRIPGVTETPEFSPDNQWIAFTRATPPAEPTRTSRARTDEERKIEERFTGKAYDWMGYRFDGRGYLPDPRDPSATPPREVYVVARAGGTPRRLTSLGVNASGLAWSPDSRTIAFTANTHQRDEHLYERADLFTVSLDSRLTRLTDDGYDHGDPAWSPDGQTLAFTREMGLSMVIASRQPQGAPTDVYTMPASGGAAAMRNLTASWDLIPGAPRWSTDGSGVVFSADVSGSTHLFRASRSGEVRQVTSGDRRLSGFSHSAAMDRMAFAAATPTRPAEVFASAGDGSAERQLSRVNDALFAGLSLSTAQRISYRSKDGTAVEGWVILPRGYEAARGPYPLILNIHGGPHGSYGNSFDFNFQLQAASGYIVVYTNPRGSTGYGEKFLWGTWGAWGDRDLEDVLAGVDHTAARYPVDPLRLGVTGYSYGGFMTDWTITQTDRFAAAVSGAGISNWVSDYGTADIPRTKESEFFGAPWEQRGKEALLRQSPIFHAGNVRTPTLFVHGESDFRVPIEQAEQMYTALQKRRVPARMVRYPDMYHGGWTPWNTVHRYHQELQWWNQWLASGRPAQ